MDTLHVCVSPGQVLVEEFLFCPFQFGVQTLNIFDLYHVLLFASFLLFCGNISLCW